MKLVASQKCGLSVVTLGMSLLCVEAARSPIPPSPKKPNIIFLLADDMGYSDAGCYGGEIKTPNIDKLAANGIKYSQCYSSARCGPSRAALLTGYYPNQVNRDKVPGVKYGKRPSWSPLLPERLKSLGYKSYHSGKWHVDGTPKQGGFDRSWGRTVGPKECDYNRFFASKIWQEDNLKAPIKKGEQYYSTIAIADHALACLKLHKKNHPKKPFFQYIAFYSPHFPLHALQADIKKYKNSYNMGWDKVREKRLKRLKALGLLKGEISKKHPRMIPRSNYRGRRLRRVYGPGEVAYSVAWDKLSKQQQKFQSMKMAIHAAMVTRMDMEIGRIIKQLKDMGEFENTIIVFQSDNGASAELYSRADGHNKRALPGSAKTYLCLGPGWANAANTPFRYYKMWVHEGGIASPFIIHWPRGIKAKGALRTATTHLIDVAPTVLSLAGGSWSEKWKGVPAPATPGKNLKPTFESNVDIKRDALWWSHIGNRAILVDGWKLVLRHRAPWELFNLNKDRSENVDLAAMYPEKVKALKKKWHKMENEFKEKLLKSKF